jgi:DnaJ-class molecular chaperone
VAYRRLLKQHHPDTGGDPSQFYWIQRAYDRAVASPPPRRSNAPRRVVANPER